MTDVDDQDPAGKYAYSFGRVRALETKLLDKGKIERMIAATGPEDVFRILAETGYGEAIEEIDNPTKFEEVLNRALKRTYEDISSFSPDPELTDMFLIEHDFHNLKVLLKAKFGELSIDDARRALVDLGLIGFDQIRDLTRANILDIPKKLLRYQKELEDVITRLTNLKDSRVIDTLMDARMHELMLKITSESDCELLTEVVKKFAAISNIKTLLRAKTLGRSKDFVDFISGPLGKLDKGPLLDIYDRSLDMILDELKKTEYSEIITKGFEYYREKGSWLLFDRLADEAILDFIKKAKYAELSLDPLIGYIIAKKSEIRLIRMIMVGKLNEIPDDKIRELLREVYV